MLVISPARVDIPRLAIVARATRIDISEDAGLEACNARAGIEDVALGLVEEVEVCRAVEVNAMHENAKRDGLRHARRERVRSAECGRPSKQYGMVEMRRDDIPRPFGNEKEKQHEWDEHDRAYVAKCPLRTIFDGEVVRDIPSGERREGAKRQPRPVVPIARARKARPKLRRDSGEADDAAEEGGQPDQVRTRTTTAPLGPSTASRLTT